MSCLPCLSAPKKAVGAQVFDLIIVGGGFSGAYLAQQYHEMNKNAKILILEKSDRLGGRLLSDNNDPSNNSNQDELGGMRVFPSQQPEVAKVIKDCGLNLEKVGMKDEENYFYADGVAQKKGTVKLDSEKNRSPAEMVSAVLEAYKAEFGDSEPFTIEAIRGLNATEILTRYGATKAEVEKYFVYTGYDLFTDPTVSGALWLNDCKLYDTSLHEDQRYVREGYDRVVRVLVKQSKAKVITNCKVECTQAENSESNQQDLRKVETSNHGDFFAKTVAYALSLPALQELASSNDESSLTSERVAHLDKIKSLPLFKCFIEWTRDDNKKQWWEEKNLIQGKSTTDHYVRQVHYYDHEDILIYNSGKNAEKINEEFLQDEKKALERIFNLLKAMHNDNDIPQPDWDSVVYKFWEDGSHKWKVGVDIPKTMNTIVLGSKECSDTNVYVCGDAFSTHQGWVMGCIETVKLCTKSMKDRGQV